MWFIFQQPDELRFRLDAERLCAHRDAPMKLPLPDAPARMRADALRQVAAVEQPCRGQLAFERS